MYYYIKGVLVHLGTDFAALDCGGVCYKLRVSGVTHAALASGAGGTALLYTYLKVSEDNMELYGFHTLEERACFTLLIGVSGVGPKVAAAVLSVMTSGQLAAAVSAGDARAISRVPGVGLKTAQKIIIELKGKLGEGDTEEAGDFSQAAPTGMSEALDALMVLGYQRGEALAALRGLDPSLPLEDRISGALKKLSRI